MRPTLLYANDGCTGVESIIYGLGVPANHFNLIITDVDSEGLKIQW